MPAGCTRVPPGGTVAIQQLRTEPPLAAVLGHLV
jgi:hypothetical protein